MEAMTLWTKFREDGDDCARERILDSHLPLVHHVARRVHRTLAQEADLDDLVSAGTMGLIDAVNTFDPGRGLAFSTFAAPRIRGAILDDLRRCDHAPRSVRRKQRDMARSRDALARTLGRAPTEQELAAALGIDLDILWRWKASAEEVVRVPIDHTASDEDGNARKSIELKSSTSGQDIEDALSSREEVELLKAEIARLKEQERIVLSLYFFKELKLHEIAEVMSLTESRISQIRTKALNTLRARLSHLRQSA